MDNIILTPSQLWGDYLPNKLLKPSYFNYQNFDSYFCFDSYFDGNSFDEETIRIFATTFMPNNFADKIIIVIKDYAQQLPQEIMGKYLELGFCVIQFDYTGVSAEKTRYTKYPSSIKYANLLFADYHLKEATPTAKDTCIYVWSTVCRSVITFANRLCEDNAEIFLLGIKSGCDIMWQVAGMDNRIFAIAGVINAGWKEFANFQRYGDNTSDFVLTDERSRWLSAVAPQSYTKFVKCPILFISASNNEHTSLDRIESTLKISDNKRVFFNACCGLSDSIDASSIQLLSNWFEYVSIGKMAHSMPTIEVKKIDDTASINVIFNNSEDISDIAINYSFDEVYPCLRNWKISNISFASPHYELSLANHALLFVYATITFKNGSSLSSFPSFIDLRDTYEPLSQKRLNHIIYQRKYATLGWYVEGNNCFESAKPILKSGELEIGGISCERGNLITYTIGDTAKNCEDTNLLQFDCFDTLQKTIKICLTTFEKGVISKYYAVAEILQNQWSKISLQLQDFKNKDFVPLKSWVSVKKLSFETPNGAIFNNLIWV